MPNFIKKSSILDKIKKLMKIAYLNKNKLKIIHHTKKYHQNTIHF